MSQILEEFSERREFVINLSGDNDRGPIINILDWLDSNIETKPILDALRSSADIDKLMPSRTGFRAGPRVSTPDEGKAFGLHLMQLCKNNNTGLHSMAVHVGIRPRFGSTAQAYISATMEQFIGPFLDHVASELEKAGENISVDETVELFSHRVFSADFGRRFPATYEAIEKIASFCGSTQTNDAWLTVGVLCREALNGFVVELRNKNLIKPNAELKAGDTKGILKEALTLDDQTGKFGTTLVALVAASWDHTQSIVHRSATTKEQAMRTFMWTGLAIAEIDSVIFNTGSGQ